MSKKQETELPRAAARLQDIISTMRELFQEGDRLIAAVDTKRIDDQVIAAPTKREPYSSATAETRAAIDGFLKRAAAGDSSVYNDPDYCHLTAWKISLDDAAELQRDIAARLAQASE